ncbi:MAG: sortase [Chloroflexota bacterium]
MKTSYVLRQIYSWLTPLVLLSLLLVVMALPQTARAAVSAGYSEYYIPGGSEQLRAILVDNDNDPVIAANLYNVITVTIAVDGVTVYYDHWENGYGTGSTGADETYVGNMGDILTFESPAIPSNPRSPGDACAGSTNPGGASTSCYDGRDRLYIVGGAVSVAQVFWPSNVGTVYANAWEIYPVKPYQTSYTIPAGEDLQAARGYDDMTNVYVIAQATQDGTTIQINDPAVAGVEVTANLNRGEVTQLFHINNGTTVTGTFPIQVQFILGRPQAGTASDTRSYTAVPSGLWGTSYYGPVPSYTAGGTDTDLYIYNPSGSPLTINYEDGSATGSFVVPANSTRSFQEMTLHYVPSASAVYLEAASAFWAIGSYDTESANYNYGFSLLPVDTLTDEYFIGWAPGTTDLSANGSPVYVTPTADGTTVFVDYSPVDGTVDASYTLDRIQMQRLFDPDNDNTGMHVWATAPIVLVWGEDDETSAIGNPYIDAGYTILPLNVEWIDAVVTIEKTADPEIIATGPGQVSVFTLVINTDAYSLDDVFVVDTLPAVWAYVPGSTTITLPDNSTITGAAADPDIAGQDLTWDAFPVDPLDMNPNETLTIEYSAITTATPPLGYSINEASVTGTRGAETFNSTDSAVIYLSDLDLEKTSSAGGTASPGDTITYTITVTNTGSTSQTDVVVTDPLPAGTTYVPGSTQVTAPVLAGTVGDAFDAIAFTGNQDSNGAAVPNWSGDWIEVGEADGAAAGDVAVVTDVSNYQLRLQNAANGVLRDVDLSACTYATLSFDYRRVGLDLATDYARLSIGPNGTLTTDLADFAGPGNDATYKSYLVDITAWISAQTRIQLLTSATADATDIVYFDNVQIDCYTTATNAGGAPPNLVTAADNIDLPPGSLMTITFQVVVNNPVPPGQTEVVNTVTVTSNEQPDPIQDTVTDVLDIPVDVWLDKRISDDTPNVGDTVTFTLVVTNDGPGTATNVEVTDVVPDGYTYVPASIAGGDTQDDTDPAGTGLVWTIASLPPGAGNAVSLTYQATVVYPATTYDNYAEVTAHDQTDVDSTPGNGQQTPDEDDDDTVTVIVGGIPAPAIDIRKNTEGPDSQPVLSGSNVTFTLVVDNIGNVDLTNVVVTDPLCDVGPTYVSGDVGADSVLGVDETWTYTCTINNITVDFTNTADVSGTPPSGPDVTDSDPSSVDVVNPAIQVDKTLTNVNFINPSLMDITYSIVVTNTGDVDLTNVQVTDNLTTAFPAPATFTVQSVLSADFTVNPAYNGRTNVNLLAGTDTLAVGATGTITLVVRVNTGGDADDYTNTAVGTGEDPTGGTVQDDGSATGPVFADPALTKAATPSQAGVGDTVIFTITVTNNGTQTATNVIVTDPLPDNLDIVNVTINPPAAGTFVVIPPRTVQVDLGDVDVDEVIVITIETIVNGLGNPPIVNEAVLTTTSVTDLLPNDVDAVTLTIGDPNAALPATGFAPGVTTVLPRQPEEKSYSALSGVWLEIPRLGIDAEIVGVPKVKGAWDVTWLNNQVGWLQGTAFPSWSGNSVITSHVYLPNGKPGPFVNLSQLRWGDKVIVHAFGYRYTYEVRQNAKVKPDDTSVLRHEDRPWVTLLTCLGYDEVTNSYASRFVVKAVMLQVEEDTHLYSR